MASFYVKSGAGAADYNAAHTYVLHDKIVPTVADVTSNVAASRKWVWECTTAGTTNGAITWSASPTQDVTTITQNGVVFTARKPGFSSGTTADWTFATIYLQYALQASTAAADVIYVSNNHAESQSSAYSLDTNFGQTVLCVNDSVAPPTALATTATITTTNNSTITPGNSTTHCYYYGISFTAGSGASGTANITIGGPGRYDNCQFILASTGVSSRITPNNVHLVNCDVKFAATAQGIGVGGQQWRWTGGSLLSGGTTPTTLIPSGTGLAVIEGVDFINAATTMNLTDTGGSAFNFTFRNCKTPALWTGVVNANAPGGVFSVQEASNVDNAGTNYTLQRRSTYGTVSHETTIVRTGGANDGVTGLSWKLVSASGTYVFPVRVLQTPEIVQWNGTTGSSITVTVEAVSSASLNNDEMWLEVLYLSASGAPLGALITSARAMMASAAAVTTSAASWASSPSTPAYQKMSVSFTPRLKGFIHATVKVCKASTTVYVDPFLTISGVTVSASRQIPGGAFVNEISSGTSGMLFIPDMAGT